MKYNNQNVVFKKMYKERKDSDLDWVVCETNVKKKETQIVKKPKRKSWVFFALVSITIVEKIFFGKPVSPTWSLKKPADRVIFSSVSIPWFFRSTTTCGFNRPCGSTRNASGPSRRRWICLVEGNWQLFSRRPGGTLELRQGAKKGEVLFITGDLRSKITTSWWFNMIDFPSYLGCFSISLTSFPTSNYQRCFSWSQGRQVVQHPPDFGGLSGSGSLLRPRWFMPLGVGCRLWHCFPIPLCVIMPGYIQGHKSFWKRFKMERKLHHWQFNNCDGKDPHSIMESSRTILKVTSGEKLRWNNFDTSRRSSWPRRRRGVASGGVATGPNA